MAQNSSRASLVGFVNGIFDSTEEGPSVLAGSGWFPVHRRTRVSSTGLGLCLIDRRPSLIRCSPHVAS